MTFRKSSLFALSALALLALALCACLVPAAAQASPLSGGTLLQALVEDVNAAVKAYAIDKDCSIEAESAIITATYSNEKAQGVHAEAENDRTATVKVGEVSVSTDTRVSVIYMG